MRILLLVALSLALLGARPAMAQEAADITASCEITVSSAERTASRLTDRKSTTIWEGEGSGKTITIKSSEPAYGLYICWGLEPRAFLLEQKVKGEWQTSEIPASPFLHATYTLLGASEIRIRPAGTACAWFSVTELYVLGEGTTPPWAQQWAPPEGDCDILFFFAHPDDEVLFFGGAIPTYAGQLGIDAVAAVLASGSPVRRGELLDSLWTMGMRQYPVFGGFDDRHSLKLATAYKNAGETKVWRFVVELLRAHRPKVVITHDIRGEYGHGMHMMCADAALYAFDAAANPAKFKASFDKFGAWQVSKLYLHLWPENEVMMDWDAPLRAFGGRTGYEVAQEAYLRHQSQQRLDFGVEPRDSAYSSYRFGLAKSAVGPDVAGIGDFLQNIDAGVFTVSDTPGEGT